MGGWWRSALVSPDGVAPSRIVSVSASVNLPLHHKVQKFSSGTGSTSPRKRAIERLWCGGGTFITMLSITVITVIIVYQSFHQHHQLHFKFLTAIFFPGECDSLSALFIAPLVNCSRVCMPYCSFLEFVASTVYFLCSAVCMLHLK